MFIRKYKSSDCKDIAELFYNTVHTINAKDYTKEQLDVWATKNIDITAWNLSFLEHHTVVVIDDNILVGFGDINKTGYLDKLYVHKDHQGTGIATKICDELEHIAQWHKITVHASITAKPFFEQRGYQVVKKQQIERQGIFLINYVMAKQF